MSPPKRAMSINISEEDLMTPNYYSAYPTENFEYDQIGEEAASYDQDPILQDWDEIIVRIKNKFLSRQPARSRTTSDETTLAKSQGEEFLKELREKYYDVLCRTLKDGKTFLHHLLDEKSAAKCCPRFVVKFILQCNPESIECIPDGNIHPLCEAIQGSLYGRDSLLVETMIEFMEKRDPNRILKNEKGEGKNCIKVAFEAMSARKPFPMALLVRLVNWSTEPMLLNTDNEDNPIPLHLAVIYERGFENPVLQPKLVKCLLDRCKKSLYVAVPKHRFRLRNGDFDNKSPCSVYEWHRLTLQKFLATNTNGHVPVAKPIPAPWGLPPPAKEGKESKKASENKASRDASTTRNIKDGQKTDMQPPVVTQKITSEKEEQPLDTDKRKSQAQEDAGTPKGTTDADRASARLLEAQRASATVLQELQLRYLRSTIETPLVDDTNADSPSQPDESDAKTFLGKNVRNILLRLDFREHPSGESMKENEIKKFFKDRAFNKILRYISLPEATVTLAKPEDAKSKSNQPTSQEKRLFYFNWLYSEKGVRKILKVTVDDMVKPCRDQDIEEAIGGMGTLKHSFDVEILEWRKLDLCPKTIERATPNVRELHLEWSGNNSVLRGWSAVDGLPSLKMLRQIHLTYTTDAEDFVRTRENITEFISSLQKRRAELKQAPQAHDEQTNPPAESSIEYDTIKVIEHAKTPTGVDLPTSAPGDEKPPDGPKHRWLKYMEDFVSFIPPMPTKTGHLKLSSSVTNSVTVALIDDGVDVFTNGMARFSDQILDGVSFDRSDDRHSPPEWYSLSGHGTLMAKLILAVCRDVKIVPYRVLMRPDREGFPRPDPASAAKAIKDAISRGVDIISMSWSIEGDIHATGDPGHAGLLSLANAISSAREQEGFNGELPLMFCAAADEGTSHSETKKEYPFNCFGAKMFRIGAATDTGQSWMKVTDHKNALFFFPGVDVPDLQAKFQYGYDSLAHDPDKNSGSSVATALAAGLAALILHCTKLGIYYTAAATNPTETIEAKDLEKFKRFDVMKEAFTNISTENITNQKFAYPAQRFENATEIMRKMDEDGDLNFPDRLKPVAGLIRNLVWRN